MWLNCFVQLTCHKVSCLSLTNLGMAPQGSSSVLILGFIAGYQIPLARIGAALVAIGDALTVEQIHAIARKDFPAEYPEIATFFAHYHLPAGDRQQLMLRARDSSADKVVADYYVVRKQMFADMFDGKN